MLIRATALLFLSGLLSMTLFTLKYEVQTQENRLVEVNRSIQGNQESLHLLAAEWAHLNDPARLRALSSTYLELQPASPDQVITLEDLARQNTTESDPADPTAGIVPPRRPKTARNAPAVSPAEDDDFAAAVNRAIRENGQ